jgi:hypothetical protein
MTVEELAQILMVECNPSCRDERCMCVDPRERFECVHYLSAEDMARLILNAMCTRRGKQE